MSCFGVNSRQNVVCDGKMKCKYSDHDGIYRWNPVVQSWESLLEENYCNIVTFPLHFTLIIQVKSFVSMILIWLKWVNASIYWYCQHLQMFTWPSQYLLLTCADFTLELILTSLLHQEQNSVLWIKLKTKCKHESKDRNLSVSVCLQSELPHELCFLLLFLVCICLRWIDKQAFDLKQDSC